MTILTSNQIRDLNIITPFKDRVSGEGVLSYGAGFYGYDITLSTKFSFPKDGAMLDPKNHDPNQWTNFETNEPFYMPANSIVLAHSVEHFNMPMNVTGVAIGKSTYARIGGFANITPLECGWRGYLTIEIANLSNTQMRVYPLEGIAQILFFASDVLPSNSYKGSKYQDQKDEVYHAK